MSEYQQRLSQLDLSILSQIREGAENEVLRRLTADPCPKCKRGAVAHEIADGQLFRLLTEATKIALAKERKATPERPAQQVNFIAILKQSGDALPPERRRELMEGALKEYREVLELTEGDEPFLPEATSNGAT